MNQRGSLAQLVEQLAFNQLVTGSNPVRPTILQGIIFLMPTSFNKNLFNELKKSFTNESILGSLLFFLVLSSWYVLRPVRNEMAVANVSDLPYLLAAGALVMLIINPIYSHIVTKTNLRKIVFYCYSFLIINLLGFLFTWKFLAVGESLWLSLIHI